MTFSASLSGAMEVGHAFASEADHAAMEHAADDQPVCCTDNPERAQTCHVLSAIVPIEAFDGVAPDCSETAYARIGLLLSGIEPSGLLDPPRAM
ncbi:hypothetical protein [Roseobacter fucihabitans]|uniref:hypothetical protein n=1 Tax=Roseobacter fucihabitans TaxID=1537242 RepID=UPI001CA31100|nr:hypothetical protein [Roseobacter litoralis]